MNAYVYAFRYGDGNHVKIGKTRELDQRRRALQGAHHHPLVLAQLIEHDDFEEGERYLQRRLAHRRVQSGGAGSREHFFVDDAELADAFEKARRYLDVELPRCRELPRFEALEAGEEILSPTEDMVAVQQRLERLWAARARLQSEKDRLDAEVRALLQRQGAERDRLGRLFQELADEEAELATTVKLAIGPAAGIDGVATWKSVPGRRHFDQEWLREDEPELFEKYRTKFDQTRFGKEQRAVYQAHMRVTTKRVFLWTHAGAPGAEERRSADQVRPRSIMGRMIDAARPRRRD